MCDDYVKFGALDNCSTFPFENYISILKNLIRKPDKPLIQVIKRLNEINSLKFKTEKEKISSLCSGSHTHGPLLENIQGSQFTTLNMEKFTIKTHTKGDQFVLTYDNDVVKVFNVIQNCNKSIFLVCKKFEESCALFDKPSLSTELDIYAIDKLGNKFICYTINDIKKKNDCFTNL